MEVRLSELEGALQRSDASLTAEAACAYAKHLDGIIANTRLPPSRRAGTSTATRDLVQCDGSAAHAVAVCATAAVWISAMSTDTGVDGLVDEERHVSVLMRALRALASGPEQHALEDRVDTWLARYMPGSSSQKRAREHGDTWISVRLARVVLQL